MINRATISLLNLGNEIEIYIRRDGKVRGYLIAKDSPSSVRLQSILTQSEPMVEEIRFRPWHTRVAWWVWGK